MSHVRFRLGELRADWAALQREPIDEFWVGPGAFVEKLFGIIEDQQRSIEELRAVFAPLLPFPPQHGAEQIAIARKVWEATEPWSAARPS